MACCARYCILIELTLDFFLSSAKAVPENTETLRIVISVNASVLFLVLFIIIFFTSGCNVFETTIRIRRYPGAKNSNSISIKMTNGVVSK